ncbi:MAG: hypothetical protein L0Z62_18970 [Gemmataceae bacterium]|nr:hypothetical protein [Gemmataceae bacterium]
MSIARRAGAAALLFVGLLAAAEPVGGQGPFLGAPPSLAGPLLSGDSSPLPDEPVSLVDPHHAPVAPMSCAFTASVTWDPPLLERLQKEFTITGPSYSMRDRRLSWVLRTKKPYPEELGDAETKLQDALNAAVGKNKLLCAFFYDGEGRKVGLQQVFLSAGERGPDNRFLVFADLNVANAEAITTRVVITLCERPEDMPSTPMPPPMDDPKKKKPL